MGAAVEQRLELEVLYPGFVVAGLAEVDGGAAGDEAGIAAFGMLAAGTVAGLATHFGKVRGLFVTDEAARFAVAGSVAVIAPLQLGRLQLGPHDVHTFPGMRFFGEGHEARMLFAMALSARF